MYTNSTGIRNIAVGACSLEASTTSSDNVAIGFTALDNNTTGSDNVAVGNNALDANTTAGNNTGVGHNALKSNTEGFENTAFGNAAGCSINIGDQNVAIGSHALNNLTEGNNNVALGRYAGADAVRNINGTCTNNIVIGNTSHTNAYIKIDWTVTSDLRDKTEIADVPHGLDFVNQITPIKYRFKTSRENDTPNGATRYGFKAQEILALEGENPVLVNNGDADNLSLTSAYLLPVLVNAIKELKAEIDELKKRSLIDAWDNSYISISYFIIRWWTCIYQCNRSTIKYFFRNC